MFILHLSGNPVRIFSINNIASYKVAVKLTAGTQNGVPAGGGVKDPVAFCGSCFYKSLLKLNRF